MVLHEVYCLIVMVSVFPETYATYVEQSPSALSVETGQSKTLRCNLKDTSYPAMYWYSQQKGKAIEALFYSAGVGALASYTSESLKAERPSIAQFILKLNDTNPSHTAVYFCACSAQPFRIRV
ncbi:hypothetical protein scyTo_0012003 [Scyliorhinus torazame]|uniref:Ig-like domain-containing protein n=1 Tax=Scyliorhinus torazame TaxID=75743 RepID=A0A401NZV2_SCYTO|nr:hypothetical protein [Scyliorhinus torazame]